MAFVNAAPQTAASVMDLIAEAQDWPKSGEFARRFKMQLPPGMVPADEMTPEMQQMQEANQQMQQMQQQVEQAQASAAIADLNAKARTTMLAQIWHWHRHIRLWWMRRAARLTWRARMRNV